MNKKIYTILGLCLMMSLTMVSAISLENIESDYNKKNNVIDFSFTEILENECSPIDVTILDHKDNVVGGYSSRGVICGICMWRGGCTYYTNTGTYNINKVFNLIPKKDIRGLGNLRYEITKTHDGELLETGRIK